MQALALVRSQNGGIIREVGRLLVKQKLIPPKIHTQKGSIVGGTDPSPGEIEIGTP